VIDNHRVGVKAGHGPPRTSRDTQTPERARLVWTGPFDELTPREQIGLRAGPWIRPRVRILGPSGPEVAEVPAASLHKRDRALPRADDVEAGDDLPIEMDGCPEAADNPHEPEDSPALPLSGSLGSQPHVEAAVPRESEV
jgi:hypothetical protein